MHSECARTLICLYDDDVRVAVDISCRGDFFDGPVPSGQIFCLLL